MMAKCVRNDAAFSGTSFRRMILNTMRCGGAGDHQVAKMSATEKPKQRDHHDQNKQRSFGKEEGKKKRNEKLSELLRLSDGEAAEAEAEEVRRKVEEFEELKRVVKRLQMESDDDVLKGAVEVRRIAKESKEGRSNLALMGAIPPLVSLLDSVNLESQIASLYALLNLAIGNDA